MNIALQLEPTNRAAPEVDYRWDPDTDILSAQLRPRRGGMGMSGSVEVEGADGSWLIFDIAEGHISGLEVVVWPDVRKNPSLSPPSEVEDADVVVPARRSQPDVASVEIDLPLMAESDVKEQLFHFRLGIFRESRAVRVARDLLLEVDTQSRLSGVWLLNVPPFPDEV